MIEKGNKELYSYLKNKYGYKQIIVAIEELSELQKELTKSLRDKIDKEHLTEEIADVKIMLEQVIDYYSIDYLVYFKE